MKGYRLTPLIILLTLPLVLGPLFPADAQESQPSAGAAGGRFHSIEAARFLDWEPAERMAENLRARGLTAFVLGEKNEERWFNRSGSARPFHFAMMAGLFGNREDADILGQRLRAGGLINDYRVVPVEGPGEIQATAAQNLELKTRLAEVSRDSQKRAEKPLPPDSGAASGQAFKKYVHGRYIASFRDPLKARDEARRLTAGGWPASVEQDGGWHRVYLAPSGDSRDFKADKAALSAAKRSAASRAGLIFLVDMSSLKGSLRPAAPNEARTDASACAGFSEAGRLGATLNRTIIYLPETLVVGLTPIRPQKMSWRDIPKRIKAWWDDEKSRPKTGTVYGPAIFNRPEMEKAIAGLNPSPEQASLALGLTETSVDLAGIPGRKVLLVFSEFQGPDNPQDLRESLNRLKAAHGSSLEVVFVYGDANGPGYELARSLAREYGPSDAWDGCRLLSDNAYFEQYIKTVIR